MIIRKILQGENHSIFINDAFRFFAHQFPQILIVYKFINARVKVTNSNPVHLYEGDLPRSATMKPKIWLQNYLGYIGLILD